LDRNANIISYEEYHPFGTTSYRAGRSYSETSLKRYKYCGKERDEESGLYYYGARYYAGWLCRWISVDPMKEKYLNLSPYAYCSNNPVNRIDPDGMDDYEVNSRGKVVNRIENTERDAFFMVDKKGGRIEGKELTFEYGTIENFKSQYSDEARTTFDFPALSPTIILPEVQIVAPRR
jgi:RHS repeat-associated protein